MFDGFGGVWTPHCLDRDLGRDPRAMSIAGTPVVLFRDGDGRAAALLDRCPQRGVALSLGKVTDGCLECPFHGWRLDRAGAVRDVPWNPEAKTARLHGTAFPVLAAGGILWLYTAALGLDAPAAEGPAIADVFMRPDVRLSAIDVTFKTHWTRAMENMLDWPHLPYVHGRTIGKGLPSGLGKRMDIELDVQPWGWRSTIAIEGEPRPGVLEHRWPNVMVLHIPVRGRTLVMLNACIPIDASSTRMFVVTARDFLTSAIFDRFVDRMNRPILEEDREVVESSHPAEVPRPQDEQSVRTDAPTLWFRKRYHAVLRRPRHALPVAS